MALRSPDLRSAGVARTAGAPHDGLTRIGGAPDDGLAVIDRSPHHGFAGVRGAPHHRLAIGGAAHGGEAPGLTASPPPQTLPQTTLRAEAVQRPRAFDGCCRTSRHSTPHSTGAPAGCVGAPRPRRSPRHSHLRETAALHQVVAPDEPPAPAGRAGIGGVAGAARNLASSTAPFAFRKPAP